MITASNPLLTVLSRRTPARRPVWLMRQAGRMLPEYRALRERASFSELMGDADLATEVTLMPMKRFDFDAAILFTDLLVPIEAMDIKVDYKPGPVLEWTFGGPGDLARLDAFDVARLEVPLTTAKQVRAELEDDKALLGFVGAPFTLAAYLVEGQGSKTWNKLRGLAWRDPECFAALMNKLGDCALQFGLAKARAGCDAIQVFDSWAGVAEPNMFRKLVGPALDKLIAGLLAEGVPVIYFVNGAEQHLDTMVATGASCLGLDWRLDLAEANERLPESLPVQGNLDPTVLLGSHETIAAEARRIMAAVAGRPHIMNLGHGLDPSTPIDAVECLLATIREFDASTTDPSARS